MFIVNCLHIFLAIWGNKFLEGGLSHWRIFIYSRTIVNKSFSTSIHPEVTFASSLPQHPVRMWLAVWEPGPHFLTIGCFFPNVHVSTGKWKPPGQLSSCKRFSSTYCSAFLHLRLPQPWETTSMGVRLIPQPASSSSCSQSLVSTELPGSSELTAFCGPLKGSHTVFPAPVSIGKGWLSILRVLIASPWPLHYILV